MYASSVLCWYEVLSVSCEPALRDGVVRARNTWEERDTPPTLQEGSFLRISNSIFITVSRSLVPTQKVRLSKTNNVLKQVLFVL